MYVPFVDLAVFVYVIPGIFRDAYLFEILGVFVYKGKLFDVGVVYFAVPVDVQHVETVHKGFVVHGYTFFEKVDVALRHETIVVDIGHLNVVIRNIHAESRNDIEEPLGVTRINDPVMIQVFKFFDHVKQQHLVGKADPAVAVYVGLFYFFPGYDRVTFGRELEDSLYVLDIRLGGSQYTVDIRPGKDAEEILENLDIVGVYVSVQIYIGRSHVVLRQVHLDRFDHRCYVLKIKRAYVAVAVDVKGFRQYVLDDLPVLHRHEYVLVDVEAVYHGIEYLCGGGFRRIGYRLAVLVKDDVAIGVRLVPAKNFFVYGIYFFHAHDMRDDVTPVDDYDHLLPGNIGYLHAFVDNVTVGRIEHQGGFGAVYVHDRKFDHVAGDIKLYFVP